MRGWAGPVTLTASPGIAAYSHHLVLAGGKQALIDVFLMSHDEECVRFPGGPDMKQNLIVVLDLM